MARIRTIKPELFRHEKLFDAERTSKLPLRLAFAGLFTASDREGRFNWSPRALKLDCLPYDDVDFEKVLDALCEHGFIVKYEIDGKVYGAIPSWHQHQHVNQREAQSIIPAPSEDCICTHVHARGEGKGREGKGMDIPTREDASPSSDFDEFKQEYPKRDGANPWKPARAVFDSLLRRGNDAKRILDGTRAYRAECDRKSLTGTDKVAQALTWLRQERFIDYQPEPCANDPATDEFMLSRGYVWSDGRWNKTEEHAA